MTPSSLDHQVKESALRVFEGLASPVSLKLAVMLRYGMWDDLASCKIDPRQYTSAEKYWADAQCISLLRKLVELPTTYDRKAVAEENFLKCEHICLRTNQRLFPYLNPHNHADYDEGVLAYFKRARKIAASILGPVPTLLQGRFGPGATYGDRGSLTTVPDKMSSRPTLTSDAFGHLVPWSGTAWAHACAASEQKVDFVRGNRFTTVPKDCEKDRGIAIEPSINVFYQLALGSAIRQRLKFQGIDLDNGQDIHRQLAREASIRGHLATLDLSNASDTVSRNLVKLLLPPRWFEALDDLRSKRTEFRDKWFLLEKFSSMGNGFTFELETLVFLCLILACDPDQKFGVGKDIFVYGDDIIVPTEISKDVISALSFSGMTINEAKSFVSGPFRESCGGDFFEGVDVRPFYLKGVPREPQQLISYANGLRRACEGAKEVRWHKVLRAWHYLLDNIPSRIRDCRGPSVLGDLLLHDDESRWRVRHRSGIRYFQVYKPVRSSKVGWKYFKPEVVLAAAVYGTSSGGERDHIREGGSRISWSAAGVTPRNPKMDYSTGWVPWS